MFLLFFVLLVPLLFCPDNSTEKTMAIEYENTQGSSLACLSRFSRFMQKRVPACNTRKIYWILVPNYGPLCLAWVRIWPIHSSGVFAMSYFHVCSILALFAGFLYNTELVKTGVLGLKKSLIRTALRIKTTDRRASGYRPNIALVLRTRGEFHSLFLFNSKVVIHFCKYLTGKRLRYLSPFASMCSRILRFIIY